MSQDINQQLSASHASSKGAANDDSWMKKYGRGQMRLSYWTLKFLVIKRHYSP